MGRTAIDKARVADTQWHIESEGFPAMAEWLRNAAPGMKDRALTGPVGYAPIGQLPDRGRRRTELFPESPERQAESAGPCLRRVFQRRRYRRSDHRRLCQPAVPRAARGRGTIAPLARARCLAAEPQRMSG